jgi:phosphoribosyl 1,2-cyclic phosphate phosphodiesterase
MKIKFLGTGTSTGIPVIGCDCEVCSSLNPKDKRLRTSVYVEVGRTRILIDSGPDVREQFLTHKISDVDGILYTHSHYDHAAGLDDLRPISLFNGKSLPLYAKKDVFNDLARMFVHIFNEPAQVGGGITRVHKNEINAETFKINDLEIQPIPVKHGVLDILGYRIKDFAYITDASAIPDTSMELLKGVKILVLNALRYREHSTHFNVSQAIEKAEIINAKQTYFTHIAHALKHDEVNSELPDGLELAYDGMEIVC